MNDEEFGVLVEEGIRQIPERFQERIKNVVFLVSDEPTAQELQENSIVEGDTLLGLYAGIPLTSRGEYYGTGMVLPDTITIFKHPILREADGNQEMLHRLVCDTVWHEVAHYFGYDDEAIEKREESGTNHSV